MGDILQNKDLTKVQNEEIENPAEEILSKKVLLGGAASEEVLFSNEEVIVQVRFKRSILDIINHTRSSRLGTIHTLDNSNEQVKSALKAFYPINPTHKDWCNDYLKLEQGIKRLENDGCQFDGSGEALALEMINLFIQPFIDFEENGITVDGIYRYASGDDLIWYANAISDYIITPEYKKAFKQQLIPLYTPLKDRYTSEMLLDAFIRLELIPENPEIYTYVMSDASGLYKIGKTTDTLKRYSTIKIGNPTVKLELVVKGDFEAILHKKFSHKNRTGEWFALDKNDLKFIEALDPKKGGSPCLQ